MSYVQELTFGDIYKADGSVVDDDTNPLMIGDLKSKPYVEIMDVEDQYGNPLSAKDLNDQTSGSTKVLFVIPDETTTSAYYSTGKFSNIIEKDGTVKTILYLASGGDMPGSMDLIITGASGQSFSKPITVKDDPYIDTLRVNYPTLYEGTDESDALEFTAVDQYGKEIKDLFNFAPTVQGNSLVFGDRNHQTGKVTTISAPDDVKWIVKKDNINKKFTVSIQLAAGTKKGATLVMMATTAGLKVTPTNLTVGQRTNGESIDTTIGGSLKLDPQNTSYNFNKNVRFLSSNGTVMDRVENAQYPIFLDGVENTGTGATYGAVTVTEDKPAFFWTVSLGKEGKVTKQADKSFTIEPTDATSAFDQDGVIGVNELDRANTGGVPAITNGAGYVEHKNATYYVTLYKASKDSSGELNVAVIDKQSFKLTYSPTIVNNEWQLGTQYTAEIKENRNLFADADRTDKVTIRVKAYPNIGEPYYVANDYITVTGDTSGIKCDPNTLQVRATAAGSATFSVYVEEPGAKQGVYTTVKVTADYKQTATKVQKDFRAVAVNGAVLNSKVGSNFDDSSRTATEWTTNAAQDGTGAVKNTVTIKDGQMTITNGNRLGEKLTLGIMDQHDLPMKDAKFFVDGLPYKDFWDTTDDGNYLTDDVWTAPVENVDTEVTGHTYNVAKHIIEVRSADDSIIQHYTIELGVADWNYTASAETTATTVYNETQLKKAFTAGKNDTVTLGKDITLTGNFGATEIEANDKLIIPAEYKLDIDDNTLTVAGTLEISGEVVDSGVGGTGKVTGGGTVTVKSGGNLDATTVDMTVDTSLHVESGATVKVTNLGGYVYASEYIVADAISAGAVITIDEGLDISDANGAIPTIDPTTTIKVDASSDAPTITLGGVEFGADEETGTSGKTEFVVDLTTDEDNATALEVANFKKTYADILAKTADEGETGITLADEDDLEAAETAYAALDSDVKALLTTEATKLEDLREYVDGLAILADANTIKAPLEGVTATGATFEIPGAYKALVSDVGNGSKASAPVVDDAASRWTYNAGEFTVTSGADMQTATATWTVSKGGYEATVTLTLTGALNSATYTRLVVVSAVSASA